MGPGRQSGRRRRERQSGQTLVVFGVIAAFILVGISALVGDTQVLYVNYNRADGTALLAAQAGASTIDEDALYQDRIQIDPAEAVSRCQSAAAQNPNVLRADCTVSGSTVIARIEQRVEMPIPLFAAQTVRATRTARPAYGGSTGGFCASGCP